MMRRLILSAAAVVMALQTPIAMAATVPTSDYYQDQDIQFFDARASATCGGALGDIAIGAVPYDPAQPADSLVNALTAMRYLILKGAGRITPEAAAGILGNLMVESTIQVSPVAEEYPGQDIGGKGIAQWTASRRVEFESAAQKAGAVTRQAQVANLDAARKKEELSKAFGFDLEYLWREATQRGDIDKLIADAKKGSTPQAQVESAVLSWERWYERAGVPALGTRGERAMLVYNEFKKTAGGPTGSSVGTAQGCATAGVADPSIAKVIEIAKKELAAKVGEYNGSCNKYVNPCASIPWCAAFINWIFNEAGIPVGGGNRAKGVGQWYEQNKQFYRLADNIPPQPGDVFVRGRNGDGTSWSGDGHIGLIISVNGNTIETIEGNSGDRVAHHVYNDYHTNIPELIGFGRYADKNAPVQ